MTVFIAIPTYWVVGVPSAWYLAFSTTMGVQGLLLGFNAAIIIQLVAFILLLWRIDWQERVNAVRARVLLRSESEKAAERASLIAQEQ